MILTLPLLRAAMPGVTEANAAAHLASLIDGMGRWAIDTTARIAAFLAQVGHESADLARTKENLNYSADGLRKTWPNRFPTVEIARQYARKPAAIANLVYANRMGNGNGASGDGARFIGRGLLMLTGRQNYHAYAMDMADPALTPDWLAQPPHAALSACWYWGSRNLNLIADYDDVEAVRAATRRINGGLIGIEDRIARWNVARAALAEVSA
ncbi:MAG: glycoside hydrolase family 19 protein [Dehalococcoidia bacterium]|nr:glycoside hydrolase family 19 protein [Dehalococcoidia bacterium]